MSKDSRSKSTDLSTTKPSVKDEPQKWDDERPHGSEKVKMNVTFTNGNCVVELLPLKAKTIPTTEATRVPQVANEEASISKNLYQYVKTGKQPSTSLVPLSRSDEADQVTSKKGAYAMPSDFAEMNTITLMQLGDKHTSSASIYDGCTETGAIQSLCEPTDRHADKLPDYFTQADTCAGYGRPQKTITGGDSGEYTLEATDIAPSENTEATAITNPGVAKTPDCASAITPATQQQSDSNTTRPETQPEQGRKAPGSDAAAPVEKTRSPRDKVNGRGEGGSSRWAPRPRGTGRGKRVSNRRARRDPPLNMTSDESVRYDPRNDEEVMSRAVYISGRRRRGEDDDDDDDEDGDGQDSQDFSRRSDETDSNSDSDCDRKSEAKQPAAGPETFLPVEHLTLAHEAVAEQRAAEQVVSGAE